MPSALPLRTDYSSADLRRLAKKTKDNNQSRRLLSLAAVLDGMNRTDAARIGGMDRQTLRNWVHRFNDQAFTVSRVQLDGHTSSHSLVSHVVSAKGIPLGTLMSASIH